MSRTIAAALVGVVRGAIAPLSRRQQHRVAARVIEGLERAGVAEIDTPRGKLTLLRLRSAHCANAAERFFTDEPETLAWIDGFADGDVLLDVGANIGTYTLYAAMNPALTVISVEPNGINFGVLTEHLAMNGLGERVLPFCIALGNEHGVAKLHMSQTEAGAGGSSLGATYAELRAQPAAFSQAMLTYSIDELVESFDLPAPTHIKLDVDGTEHEIIAGAAATLRQVRSVLVEIEERGERDVEQSIVGPLGAAGLVEDPQARASGSGRNRLYRRV